MRFCDGTMRRAPLGLNATPKTGLFAAIGLPTRPPVLASGANDATARIWLTNTWAGRQRYVSLITSSSKQKSSVRSESCRRVNPHNTGDGRAGIHVTVWMFGREKE